MDSMQGSLNCSFNFISGDSPMEVPRVQWEWSGRFWLTQPAKFCETFKVWTAPVLERRGGAKTLTRGDKKQSQSRQRHRQRDVLDHLNIVACLHLTNSGYSGQRGLLSRLPLALSNSNIVVKEACYYLNISDSKTSISDCNSVEKGYLNWWVQVPCSRTNAVASKLCSKTLDIVLARERTAQKEWVHIHVPVDLRRESAWRPAEPLERRDLLLVSQFAAELCGGYDIKIMEEVLWLAAPKQMRRNEWEQIVFKIELRSWVCTLTVSIYASIKLYLYIVI